MAAPVNSHLQGFQKWLSTETGREVFLASLRSVKQLGMERALAQAFDEMEFSDAFLQRVLKMLDGTCSTDQKAAEAASYAIKKS